MNERPFIHSLTFAQENGFLTGEAPLQAFPRLADVLAETSGHLKWALSGKVDRRHWSHLQLSIEGELQLKCQRCLSALAFPLDVQADVVVFSSDHALEAAEKEDETLDAMVDEGALDVLFFIEDEILLNIPLSYFHEQCGSASPVELAVLEEVPQRPNPFAVLAQLKISKESH